MLCAIWQRSKPTLRAGTGPRLLAVPAADRWCRRIVVGARSSRARLISATRAVDTGTLVPWMRQGRSADLGSARVGGAAAAAFSDVAAGPSAPRPLWRSHFCATPQPPQGAPLSVEVCLEGVPRPDFGAVSPTPPLPQVLSSAGRARGVGTWAPWCRRRIRGTTQCVTWGVDASVRWRHASRPIGLRRRPPSAANARPRRHSRGRASCDGIVLRASQCPKRAPNSCDSARAPLEIAALVLHRSMRPGGDDAAHHRQQRPGSLLSQACGRPFFDCSHRGRRRHRRCNCRCHVLLLTHAYVYACVCASFPSSVECLPFVVVWGGLLVS